MQDLESHIVKRKITEKKEKKKEAFQVSELN